MVAVIAAELLAEARRAVPENSAASVGMKEGGEPHTPTRQPFRVAVAGIVIVPCTQSVCVFVCVCA